MSSYGQWCLRVELPQRLCDDMLMRDDMLMVRTTGGGGSIIRIGTNLCLYGWKAILLREASGTAIVLTALDGIKFT